MRPARIRTRPGQQQHLRQCSLVPASHADASLTGIALSVILIIRVFSPLDNVRP